MIWPFADPPNVAVFTSADIVDRGMPILYVVHDEDDGAWQFHSVNGPPSEESEARVVGLKTIFALDSSIAALVDLKLGWCARRSGPDGAWRRERCGK
jgi:hypothetical protein